MEVSGVTKYKPGDRVRVISEIPDGKRTFYMEDGAAYNTIATDMYKWLGTIVTIDSNIIQYKIVEDCGKRGWTDEMFEGLATGEDPEPEAPQPEYSWEDLF